MTSLSVQLSEEYFRRARITDELSDTSVEKYKESLKRFFKVVGDKEFREVREADFENFVVACKEKGNKSSGIIAVINAVKWIMRRLQRDGIIENLVDLDKIKMPKIAKRDVEYLTEDEIRAFLGAIEADLRRRPAIRKIRAMTLYVLLLETGARISEALSIKVKDIDFNSKEIPIVGKGNKPRTLFIQDRTADLIKRYLEVRKGSSEYLFVTQSGASQWSDNDVNRGFLRHRRLSGVKKHFTIHTFRHTFATQLLHRGIPMNTVQYLLGHANLETTMKYYIGTIKKEQAKQLIKAEHFSFLPDFSLQQAS